MGTRPDYTNEKIGDVIKKDLERDPQTYISRMVFPKGGPANNGIIHPAQVSGYDLDKIIIGGKNTRSLRGLPLKSGTVKNDVLVVELPHPTYLSNVGATEASAAVKKNLEVLKPYVNAGWKILADPGMTNSFSLGQDYRYARADIGPEYYDFGTPGSRMVPVSTASRMSGNAHVIVVGTRDRVGFDMNQINAMTNASPAEAFSSEEMLTTRPRSLKLRYTFDPGPGEAMAKLMKENLDLKTIYKTKPGKTFAANGIDAYYVKTHPDIGDFGHYRGTFQAPKIVILADPIGLDDTLTARALTGLRGQYVQGLMRDLGVGDKYLVLKTVPFGMDGATKEDWDYVLKATRTYRQKILAATGAKVVLADGPYAQAEAKALGLTVIPLNRSVNFAADMKAAAPLLAPVVGGTASRVAGTPANIPRTHLSFYARIWEGTSGDSVLNASDKFRGQAFAIVAPAWAWKQKSSGFMGDQKGSDNLIRKLEQNKLPLPKETVPQFLQRARVTPDLPDAA